MKKLNRSFLKKFNAVLIVLLAVFGFSGCNPDEPYDPNGDDRMYGSPRTEFVVKEKVADQDE